MPPQGPARDTNACSPLAGQPTQLVRVFTLWSPEQRDPAVVLEGMAVKLAVWFLFKVKMKYHH